MSRGLSEGERHRIQLLREALERPDAKCDSRYFEKHLGVSNITIPLAGEKLKNLDLMNA